MWNCKCNGLCSGLEGQRVRESERVRERQKSSKKRADYVRAVREQRYVGEQMEKEYLKFCLLIILGSGGI